MFDSSAFGSGEPAENQATSSAPVTHAAMPVAGWLVESEADADQPNPPGPSGLSAPSRSSGSSDSTVSSGPSGLSASSPVAEFAALLAGLRLDIPDAALLDRIRQLEELKAAASAAQARTSAAFDTSQRAAQAKAGMAKDKQGEGIASQIALARRDSPARGSRHLGLAHALTKEMPHTLAALSTGILNEWRATLLVRETACLDADNRARVDETLAADPTGLEGLGDKRLIAAAKKEAYRIDPHTVVRRAAKAANERTVTIRPAPDTMTYLTALLPVAQGVAVHAALERTANQARAAGDERGRGQLMADTLIDRITHPTPLQHGTQGQTQDRTQGGTQDGRQGAKPGPTAGADLEIQLVMTDRALLAGDHEPAHLTGYGTVPAGWARDLILGPRTTSWQTTNMPQNSTPNPGRHAGPSRTRQPGGILEHLTATPPGHDRPDEQTADEARVWIRRLYTAPGTGQLIAMDSTARIFPKNLRKLIITRDQTCRTPFCDAPIRQIDHILSHGIGGQTNETNGAGLCERCNQAKTANGHRATPIPGNRHTIEITTPTGHLYHSTAPPLPGTGMPPPPAATPAAAGPAGPAKPGTPKTAAPTPPPVPEPSTPPTPESANPAPSDTAHKPTVPPVPPNELGYLPNRTGTARENRAPNIPPPKRPPRIGRNGITDRPAS